MRRRLERHRAQALRTHSSADRRCRRRVSRNGVRRWTALVVIWTTADTAARTQTGSLTTPRRIEFRKSKRPRPTTQREAGLRLRDGTGAVVNVSDVDPVHGTIAPDRRFKQ